MRNFDRIQFDDKTSNSFSLYVRQMSLFDRQMSVRQMSVRETSDSNVLNVMCELIDLEIMNDEMLIYVQ